MKTRLVVPIVGIAVIAGLVHAAVQEMPMPKPTAHHQRLKDSVGTWDCTVKTFVPAPSESNAVATRTMVGDFWLVEDFTGDFGGMPFTGRSTLGYDSRKQKFVGTWIDSASEFMSIMEGTADAAGKTRTMSYEAPSETPPGIERHRDVWDLSDTNKQVLSMYVTPGDGKERLAMQITYQRRKP